LPVSCALREGVLPMRVDKIRIGFFLSHATSGRHEEKQKTAWHLNAQAVFYSRVHAYDF
jgi:hypothetical protein